MGSVPDGEYFKTSVPELTKIAGVGQKEPQDTKFFCWFEEDLFCQVNFWFVLNSLAKQSQINPLYFVRPKKGCEYSCAHMSKDELVTAYEKCTLIPQAELEILAKFWPCYQLQKFDEMLALYLLLPPQWRFLKVVINAQIDRAPDENGFGRAERTLIQIMNELNSQEFGTVFREFMKREAIYSFGDLQVKRMFDDLCKNNRELLC